MTTSGIQHILATLGQELGTTITLDGPGGAQLAIDDMILGLVAGENADSVTAFVFLGTVAGTERRELLRLMLQANYGWSATGGGTLALDKDGHALLIARWSQDMERTELVRALTEFLNAAESWQRTVIAAAQRTTEGVASAVGALPDSAPRA